MTAIQRLASHNRTIVAVALCAALMLSSGCGALALFFYPDPHTVLKDLVDELDPEHDQDRLTIRLANSTTNAEVRITLRIDGEEKTYVCDDPSGTCDFILLDIPLLIEALEESRWDEEGKFTGGTVLEGQRGFTFTNDDFRSDSVIVFVIGTTEVESFVL